MAIKSATENVWKKAATGPKARRDLRGLQGLEDWTVPRKMLGKLGTSSPNDAGTLRNILAGGTWPQVRVAEVDKEVSTICPCCQERGGGRVP
eukprot:3532430-Heterocapsa_arctica.AAC.1